MVKFGRHLQFYLESDELQQSDGGNEDPYIVPYTDIRESIGHSQHQFVQEWTSSLKLASDDYTRRLKFLWKRIFDDVFSSSSALTRHHKSNGNPFVNNDVHDDFGFATKFEEEHRGLPNDRAIQLYVTTMEEIRSIELFAYMKKLHSAAAMNGEALRKLVKKFDKGALARGDDLLTSAMFPDLYSASFMSYRSLDNYIGMMRDTLGVSEEDEETTAEDENEDTLNSFQRKHRNDDVVIQGRSDELSWLHNTLARLPYLMLTSLVAHRGFHCPRDGSYRRPLKNSLAAFESAWCSGIYLCDCDIALTKDEKLVLANNDDFSVGDLT